MPRVRFAPEPSSPCFSVLLLLSALVILVGGIVYASTPERASTWRQHEIRVDGSDEEWQGEELPVKGQHFALGIVNDGEWLYICLPTKDVGTRTQIGNMGIVFWLDPVGGKKRRFGIHFPVPNPPGSRPMARGPRELPPDSNEPTREGQPPVRGQDEIGILGPGKNDAQLVPIGEAGGIEARVGVRDDLMVYEVKVPLVRTSDHPYAPNVKPGEVLRLQIETAPLRPGTAALPPGGIGGVPGRPWGAGWGITIGGPRRTVIEPIDVTMNVKLAAGGANGQ